MMGRGQHSIPTLSPSSQRCVLKREAQQEEEESQKPCQMIDR